VAYEPSTWPLKGPPLLTYILKSFLGVLLEDYNIYMYSQEDHRFQQS